VVKIEQPRDIVVPPAELGLDDVGAGRRPWPASSNATGAPWQITTSQNSHRYDESSLFSKHERGRKMSPMLEALNLAAPEIQLGVAAQPAAWRRADIGGGLPVERGARRR
jgi:hypothetical protein